MFENNQYGIDFNKLQLTDGVTEIKGRSGSVLFYELSDRQIIIEDQSFENLHVSACVDENSELTIGVQTKSNMTGERHPDLFAGQFVGFALEYFKMKRVKIDHFRAHWEGSDTYKQFMQIFNETHDPVAAVKNTWTYQIMAIEHKFTEVSDIDIQSSPDEERVTAIFRKPINTKE